MTDSVSARYCYDASELATILQTPPTPFCIVNKLFIEPSDTIQLHISRPFQRFRATSALRALQTPRRFSQIVWARCLESFAESTQCNTIEPTNRLDLFEISPLSLPERWLARHHGVHRRCRHRRYRWQRPPLMEQAEQVFL